MRSVLKSLPLLLGLCVLATIGDGIAEATLAPAPTARAATLEEYSADTLRVSGWAAIVAAPDSVVKLGTAVTGLRGMLPGDTLHYSYWTTPAPGVTGPDTLIKRVRKLTPRDSISAPAPAYAKTRHYKGCLDIEIGGRTSGRRWPAAAPMCWTWAYTRPDRADPGFEGIDRLVIRPMPPPLGGDQLSTCAGWQAAHPGASVWRSAGEVNRHAIPECTTDTQLLVWQFCTFAEDTAGTPLIVRPSTDVQYCLAEFEIWKSERAV